MTDWELMQLADSCDDDAFEYFDFAEPETADETERFKEKYKAFYTDIKNSVKEDW